MKYFLLAILVLIAPSTTAFGETKALDNRTFEQVAEGTAEHCLALNIYFEARAEPLVGQIAVSDVVLNRVKDTRWPNTVCGVVFQGPTYESWKTRQTEDPSDAVYYPKRDRCQFSWYCDGKSDIPRQEEAWIRSQELAYRILNNKEYLGITEGATHYHANYVNPRWAKHFQLIGHIGTHIFYRQSQ